MNILKVVVLSIVLVGCQTPEEKPPVVSTSETEEKQTWCGPTPINWKEQFHLNMLASNPGMGSRELTEEQVAIFTAAFNASPPPTNLPVDAIVVYHRPGLKSVFVMMSKGDCVVAAQQLSFPVFKLWMSGKPVPPKKKETPDSDTTL